MSKKVLEIINFNAGYTEVDILNNLSLYVQEGEIISVIGPNGAGKTTALKGILGLLNIRGGQIILDGNNITGISPEEAVIKGISYVPQVNNVFVSLTVQENLEMGAWTRQEGVKERLNQMYDIFPDLKEKRYQEAGTLSGGQRQMLAMAKALMIDAKVLLLDEPTAGLSPKYRGEIFERIQRIRDSGVPILIIEQNAKQSLGISDRAYVLVSGANKVTGTGAELLADREVARMFLGGKE